MTPEELDQLAKGLHHEWESPDLLPRMRAARRPGRRWLPYIALIAAALVVGLYFAPRPGRPIVPINATAPLLDEQALADVEAAEAAYRKSIDRLARVASPRLNAPATPLLRAYAQKIAVLDAAIGELTTEIGRNGFNTNLRLQMAALYRDKQQTLEQVLHHE